MKKLIFLITVLLLINLLNLAQADKPVRIFILAGQSNMDGRGDRELLPDHLMANQNDVMFLFHG